MPPDCRIDLDQPTSRMICPSAARDPQTGKLAPAQKRAVSKVHKCETAQLLQAEGATPCCIKTVQVRRQNGAACPVRTPDMTVVRFMFFMARTTSGETVAGTSLALRCNIDIYAACTKMAKVARPIPCKFSGAIGRNERRLSWYQRQQTRITLSN